MVRPKILITRALPAKYVEPLKNEYDIKMWPSENKPATKEFLEEEITDAVALFSMLSDPISKGLLAKATTLQVIANLAVGYDNIDIQAANRQGIVVCNTPDILSDTTADLTFALLMATARRIVEAAELVKAGQWKSWSPYLLAGRDIHHKTIGIVGMGKIGEAIGKRATGFDMEIFYHNRTRKLEAEQKLGVVYKDFDSLLRESDFVVCMTPLTEETKGLFGEKQFKLMKNTAIFINAARGAVVDEVALQFALENGEIAGAGLDVFQIEPIGADHPLLKLSNVVALPHIGSASIETRSAMIELCIENIERVLRGDRPKTLVKA